MHDDQTQLQVREAMRDALREAERVGLTQAILARRAGFSAGVLSSWANGHSDIDLWRFVKLCRELPDEAASLVFEGIGKALRTVEGQGCFDELAGACSEYQSEHITARNDNSPGGPAIVHCEKLSLVKKARRVRDAADAVIAAHGAA